MPSRCFEFVDSRLRRSPPDRASAVPMDKLGKRNAFPPPCPQVGGCPQASQQPQQRCDNFVSGNDQPSSRLPAFSLFFPGSCPNNRDRRTLPHLVDHIAMGAFDVFQIPYSALEREHEAAIASAASKGAGIVIRGGLLEP